MQMGLRFFYMLFFLIIVSAYCFIDGTIDKGIHFFACFISVILNDLFFLWGHSYID